MEIISTPVGGEQLNAVDTMYPSYLRVVSGTERFAEQGATCYGYVLSGTAQLCGREFQVTGGPGTFFSWPGEFTLEATGLTVLMCRLGFRGLLSVGRIESQGRLSYIDGCSSTILVAPPRSGDPVLNYLHFQPDTRQTEHSHSSLRLGVVARGRGVSFRSKGVGGPGWEQPLRPGSVFLLSAHERHAFATPSDQCMEVITYHPDSDWGPADESHPMLSRTHLLNSARV